VVKYRKNEKWDSFSVRTSEYQRLDSSIKLELKHINYDDTLEYVDIVDISIRSIPDGGMTYHYATVFYAIIPLECKEIKVNI